EGKKVIIEAEDAGDSYIVRVKDFGEGVPDEFKEPIFERFKRREKRGVKGTGLGLAIVKRIAELHSGKVWVEDNSPKGAVFVVKLPKKHR
ncbi:sensor histidine kinase, partial [Candidatus Pyrohabitans sp.]